MKTTLLRSFVLAVLLAACGPKTSTTSQPGDGATTGTGAAPVDPAEPADPVEPADPPEPVAAAPGRGETCGEGDACAEGLECVTYYGIAGPRGPEFKSCETRCGGKTTCPDGTTCQTIADGPGQVCR